MIRPIYPAPSNLPLAPRYDRPQAATGGAAPRPADVYSYGRRDTTYNVSGATATDGSVRQLQLDLQSQGYFRSSYGATGGYFADTREAVRHFQADHGLSATGRADDATRRAIADAARRPAPVASWAPAPPPRPLPVPPPPPPAPRPLAAPAPLPMPSRGGDARVGLSTAQLAALGRQNPRAFFEALRPAAEACERRYGVPAAVTLGQAALESGFAQHTPGGTSNNLFGHKGNGPAGGVRVASWEAGHSYKKVSTFACYNDVSEGLMDHGAVFHNGYYPRTVSLINTGNRDPRAFLRSIEGVYHQDGSTYTNAVMSIINRYNLA